MKIRNIPESEYKFCLIMWEKAPATASALSKICYEQLGWKITTTYTVIKRLEEKGVLKREKNGMVTPLITKEEAEDIAIEDLVQHKFGGSVPSFMAAFTKKEELSDADLDELQDMIDRIRQGRENA